MTGFRNPVVGGQGDLVRQQIRSPNFVTGVSGWIIRKDGSSEFSEAVIRGTIVSGDLAGSHIIIDPGVGVGFNDGFLEAVIRMFPDDLAMLMMEGMLGVVTFNAGQASADMATVLHSPVGQNRGMGLVLAADADDASTAVNGSMGVITVDGDAMTYIPVFTVESYGVSAPVFLAYESVSTEIIESFGTAGTFTWTAPPGVTSVLAEVWGAGGHGAVPGGNTGGGGGGGGEYASQTVAVTPGNNYTRVVGAGSSSPAAGGFSSFVGDAAATVKAFGGSSSTTRLGVAGGTGSTNTVHHNGGAGGDGLSTGGGGGGGGSASTTAVGGQGVNTSGVGSGGAGGAGGATGGGKGGHGGAVNGGVAGSGSAPGGGGGGNGGGIALGSGNGAAGMIRLTYQSAVVPVPVSQAGQPGTDKFGNSYPAGFAVGGSKVPDARHFQMLEGNGNTSPSITTSFVDIPGVTVTFTTLNPNAMAMVTATFDNQCTVAAAGALTLGQLVVDGASPAKQLIGSAAVVNRECITQSWVVTLPATGAHTIKMQGRKSAGTVIIQAIHTGITVNVVDCFS